MNLLYATLYQSWISSVNPNATTARMVRTALKYLAGAVGADDWSSVTVVPEQHAIVLLDGALGATTLGAQSKSNYRNYLRRLYRFAEQEEIEITGAGSTKLWAPAPNHGTVPRRAQVAYDRFVKWAIGHNVWSDTVKPQHLLDWALAERSKTNAHWRRDYQRLHTAWDALASDGSLPAVTFLPLPANRNSPYALAPEKWPIHLIREWQEICRAASAPLRKGGMRPWRRITRDAYQLKLSLFLGWFTREHPDADLSQENWASLLTAERCQEHINWLVTRSGKTYLNPSHTALLRSVRGLHRFQLGSPEPVIQAFTDLCRRCEIEERDKAARMVPFTEVQRGYCRLLDEVLRSMKDSSGKRSDASLANMQVNVIILGLLTTRALRRSNITNIRVGDNLVQSGQGYELRYGASEMKGHKRFDVTVPAELAPIIADYLRRGYFALTGRIPRDGDPLLLASTGHPFATGTFSARVRKLTRKYMGKQLHPHLFRHMLATHAAQVWRMTPTELAAFLAHRNVLTVMKYYEVTSPSRAAERLDGFRATSQAQ